MTTRTRSNGPGPTVLAEPGGGRPFRRSDVVRFMASAEQRQDPYRMYRRLQAHERVHHSVMAVTLVSGYDDVLALLKHPDASSDETKMDRRFRQGRLGAGRAVEVPARAAMWAASKRMPGTTVGPFTEMARRFLLLTDPPDHERLRRLVVRAFTPRTVDALVPRIEAIADELLDGLAPDHGGDLLASYAYRLPVIVICELLGVPAADHERFAAWVPPLVTGFDAAAALSRGVLRRADEAALELDGYLRSLIEARRADPTDDLISRLVAAADGDDRLSQDEVVAFVALLLVAGHETTANMIGNGLVALWSHPEQLARWRDDEAGRVPAVEELLRFDSTIQMTQRITLAPVSLPGGTIPAGRLTLLLVAAANRDPERFTDPDRLDLGRDEGPSLSFGFGIHHCLGASLARAEVAIGLGRLIDRLPGLATEVDALRWRNNLVFRGLEAFPATW